MYPARGLSTVSADAAYEWNDRVPNYTRLVPECCVALERGGSPRYSDHGLRRYDADIRLRLS